MHRKVLNILNISHCFMSDEIAKEKTKLKEAQEDAKKLKNELNRVVDECNGYKTAAALAESSQKEEIQSLYKKYQEEVASLQHIMSGKYPLAPSLIVTLRLNESSPIPAVRTRAEPFLP